MITGEKLSSIDVFYVQKQRPSGTWHDASMPTDDYDLAKQWCRDGDRVVMVRTTTWVVEDDHA